MPLMTAALGACHIDAIGAEEKNRLGVHGCGVQVYDVDFARMLGRLAPGFGEVEAERRAFLQRFGVVENAFHVATDLG